MAACCIGGVCIPYSAILPLIMVFLQYLLRPLAKLGLLPSWMADMLGVTTSAAEIQNCNGSCEGIAKKINIHRRPKKLHSNQTEVTTDSISMDDSSAHDSSEKDRDCNFSISIKTIGSTEEFEKILQGTDILIVKFTASWCKPCKAIQPVFQQKASKYVEISSKEVEIVTIDVDEVDDVSSKYKVTMMPTFMAFQHGKPVSSMSGVNENKLETFLKEAILGP